MWETGASFSLRYKNVLRCTDVHRNTFSKSWVICGTLPCSKHQLISYKNISKLSHLILRYTGLFEVVFSIDLPCIQVDMSCCVCTVLLRVVCGVFFSATLKNGVVLLFHDVTLSFLLISLSVAKPDRVLEDVIFCSLSYCWSYIIYNRIYGIYQIQGYS